VQTMEGGSSCASSESPFQEKMSADQVTAVKRREMGKAPSDVWFDIYKVLFPGAPLPSNPYAEETQSGTVQRFTAYFEREAPGILAAEINTRMFGYDSTIPEHQMFIESVLTDSIRVLLQRINAGFESVG